MGYLGGFLVPVQKKLINSRNASGQTPLQRERFDLGEEWEFTCSLVIFCDDPSARDSDGPCAVYDCICRFLNDAPVRECIEYGLSNLQLILA